ncbi:MAG: amino acid adenylation domain-containing protein, partial [Catenulispora sp.]|nr:amino acid adenylation domain-containing protein [Catenulispora sp.]
LLGRADRIAGALSAAGVSAAGDAVVAVLVDRGVDLLPSLLGVWRAGAAYLPLDAGTPPARIGAVLADAGVRAVITQSTHAASVADVFDGPLVIVDGDLPETTVPMVARDPESLAYVIYTSGSTGTPKGVQVTHAGLANHVHAARDLFATGPGGAPVFSSVAFDLVIPQLFVPLTQGRPVALLPAERGLDELGTWLTETGPHAFVKLTPSHLRILTTQLTPETAADLIGVLIVAGEALPTTLAKPWLTAFGTGRVINEYGPTEATVGTCINPLTTPPTTDIVPIGRSLPGMTMRVLNEDMQPMPVGAPGELYVGGAGVARGYLNAPGRTARRFVPDPFGPAGSRLYRTGDQARWLPEGTVEFLGRRDGQVKIRGHRIELGEIEAVLAGHPAVREAAAVVRDGGSGPTLAAFVVPVADQEPDGADLRAWLARHLPEPMIPQVFVPSPALPLNANGKTDRAALADLAGAAADVRRPAPPATPTEKTLARIVGEVLGSALVGVEHTFTELGAHSLLIVQVVAAVRRAGLPLTLTLLYRNDTIRKLAAALDTLETPDTQSPQENKPGGARKTAAVAPSPMPVAAPEPRGFDAEAVAATMQAHHVPGVQIALLQNGELIGLHCFGATTADGKPIDDRTPFPAGSVSKHITALTALRLVDTGVLTLDGDIAEHLDGWQVPGVPGAPLTVRHLLSHTSGLRQVAGGRHPRGTRPPELAELVHAKAERELEPGGGFRKAGVNFWLLQHVMENATGERFDDLVRTLVREPLGLSDTGFDPGFPETRTVAVGHDDTGTPVPGGWEIRVDAAAAGLWTTAADLAAVAGAIRRSHLGRPRSLLTRQSAEAMLAEAAPGSFFGLGTVVDTVGGRHWFGHGGELTGHRAMTMCEAHSGDGYVVLTNGAGGDQLIRLFTAAADLPGPR